MNDSSHEDYFSVQYCFEIEEEKILSTLNLFAQNQVDLMDINRVLELYNIRLYFDKHYKINDCEDDKYSKYREAFLDVIKAVTNFFDSIDQNNLVEVYEKCDVVFWDDFWHFFYQFKIYERIEKNRFDEITYGLKMSPDKMLENKSFVDYFSEQIIEKISIPEFGAPFLIRFFLEHRYSKDKCYLPCGMRSEQIYKTIDSYIEHQEYINANLLALIIESKSFNTKRFNPDDGMRYKAKKRLNKILEDNSLPMIRSKTGINISFAPENPEAELTFENNNIYAKYNYMWIKENQDYSTILNNFIYLFGYVDWQMRCTLTNSNNERGVFEDIFSVSGNGMYKKCRMFELKNMLANAQMECYMNVLREIDIYLERVCKWFFEEYLKDEFKVEGFICTFPKSSSPLLEKCKLFVSAMEGAIKQYKLFIEDGKIDRGLYEMSSTPISYRDLPGFVKNKYAYISDSNLIKEMNLLFSTTNLLGHIERIESKYSTLEKLLSNEQVSLDDFREYQINKIRWLITQQSLYVEDNTIKLNMERVTTLKQFYSFGYICLQYYKSECLKQMICEKKVKVSSGLLSEPEYQYINYILNKREYSNGLDLRNKYIHDSIVIDENTQNHDYAVIMKVMIILIIKINEEFCLRDEYKKGKVDFYEL